MDPITLNRIANIQQQEMLAIEARRHARQGRRWIVWRVIAHFSRQARETAQPAGRVTRKPGAAWPGSDCRELDPSQC